MPHPEPRVSERRLVARLWVQRRTLFAAGVALLAVGLLAVAWPVTVSRVIGAMAGWALWFAGGAMIAVSLVVRDTGSFFGAVLTGLIAVAAGAYLFFHPHAGSAAMTVLLTAVLVVDGAFEIALALDLRPLAAWRWVLGSAISSIVAGVLIASGLPRESPVLYGLMLGAALATTGLAFIVLSRTRRPRSSPRNRGRVSEKRRP